MPIKASSARHIDALLAALRSADEVAREAAIARLTVIGARAIERLGALAGDPASAINARSGALRALEGIGDERAFEIALGVARAPETDVAVAAINVVRTFLSGAHDLPAVDALTAIAVDRSLPDAVRESALGALRDVGPTTLGPVIEALLSDPSARLRALAQGATAPPEPDAAADQTWLARDSDEVPDDPARVRQSLDQQAAQLALPRLHQVIAGIREHEQNASGARRQEWMRARAAAHVALATRGSRLALYDLRESLDAAREPLPVEFLAAVTLIGDVSCLEPLAAAYMRATHSDGETTKGDWWHRHLAEAFQTIAARESITRRHGVAKRIEKRWPTVLQAVWPASARGPKRDV